MGCACSSRENIEDIINLYINDLVLSKTSINEYKTNLITAVKKDKIYDQKIFETEFLNPLFESSSGQRKELKPIITEYLYEIKDENFVFFIVALAFLCDTLNYASLKSNYEIILYNVLPHKLTRVIKSKSDLRVFRKFLKFYVRLVSQNILNAMEQIYNKTAEEKNAIEDLKTVYSDVCINEFVKRLLANETEKDFNLEKFINARYEDLKHFKIRQKLSDIFNTGIGINYDEKHMQEMNASDIFSDVSGDNEEDLELEEEPEEVLEVSNLQHELMKSDTETDKLIEPILVHAAHNPVEIKEQAHKTAEPIAKHENKPKDYSEPKYEIAAEFINKISKGKLFRKHYKKSIKSDLEKQQAKINQYIINNFTHPNVKLADENRKIDYDIDGWDKFYPANTKTFNPQFGNVHETKISITNSNEYYSGLLNLKGQKHGFGISIQRQGERYQGFFFDNQYHGWGELIDKQGNLFQGQFLHGVLTGKGEKYALDGTHFIGEFENFQKHGQGEENSEFYNYQGGFHRNKKQGKGKIYMKVLKDSYEGDFYNDAITGKGEYHWSNNNSYIGEFLNGKMHGKGVNKWPDGTVYEGDYINGVKEGHGRYERSNGKIYEGPFKNGKPHGKGKLTTDKGTFDVKFEQGKLVSQVVSGANIALKASGANGRLENIKETIHDNHAEIKANLISKDKE